jgi:hypothetical protein
VATRTASEHRANFVRGTLIYPRSNVMMYLQHARRRILT